MWRALWLLTFSMILLSRSISAAEHLPVIVIDPGHGGKDPGSVYFGRVEKDLTLALALQLERVLTDRGVSSVLVRRDDSFVELSERAEVANSIPGAILISLHFNAHPDSTISGTETFFWPESTSGQALSLQIQNAFGNRLASRNRGFHPKHLKVLELTHGPAVLVECGFISNRWESLRCASEWFQQILAEQIAEGLIRYCKAEAQ